jgi:2-C-methyl-D-erythritol 2,4-cyclodiphosphate synthase
VAVGIGFDLHRLEHGRVLRIAGVEIPHDRGFAGHSDGDVVLHALVDALLGAAGAGDIGSWFPDDDPRWKDADSAVFVRTVLAQTGVRPLHVDVTVLLERPALAPHREAMRARVAELVRLPLASVNLKAKTMEGIGPIGAGEAGAAFVAVEAERAG